MTNSETASCPSCGAAQRELSNGHFLCDECGVLTPRPSARASASPEASTVAASPFGASEPAAASRGASDRTARSDERTYARATSAGERAAAQTELSNLLTERATLVRRMDLLRDGASEGRLTAAALGFVSFVFLAGAFFNFLWRPGGLVPALLYFVCGAPLGVFALRRYFHFRRRRNAFVVDSKAFGRQLADLDRRIERCEAIVGTD